MFLLLVSINYWQKSEVSSYNYIFINFSFHFYEFFFMYLKLLLGRHTFIIIKCLSVPGNTPCSEIYFVWKYCFFPCIPFPFFYFQTIYVFIFVVCYSISELWCLILISVPKVTDALFISVFFSMLFIQDSFYHCVSNLLISYLVV